MPRSISSTIRRYMHGAWPTWSHVPSEHVDMLWREFEARIIIIFYMHDDILILVLILLFCRLAIHGPRTRGPSFTLPGRLFPGQGTTGSWGRLGPKRWPELGPLTSRRLGDTAPVGLLRIYGTSSWGYGRRIDGRRFLRMRLEIAYRGGQRVTPAALLHLLCTRTVW